MLGAQRQLRLASSTDATATDGVEGSSAVPLLFAGELRPSARAPSDVKSTRRQEVLP